MAEPLPPPERVAEEAPKPRPEPQSMYAWDLRIKVQLQAFEQYVEARDALLRRMSNY